MVCAEKAPKALTMFDDQLAQTEFLAGDQFSIADITLGVALDFARSVKVVELPELEHIKRWQGQLNSRPSFFANATRQARPLAQCNRYGPVARCFKCLLYACACAGTQGDHRAATAAAGKLGANGAVFAGDVHEFFQLRCQL